MQGRSVRLAIGVAGTGAAFAGETIAMQGGVAPAAAFLSLAIGLTYLYGGLAIWDHEPVNRTGRLMTAVGLTWFIGTLVVDAPAVRRLGPLAPRTLAFLLALVPPTEREVASRSTGRR
jgi:hypothetical protein